MPRGAAIDETLATYDLDAIMAPTNSPAWVTTLGEGDAFLFGSSGPAAVSGYPNVTVPAGYVGPLPVGMSFFSTAWADGDVLEPGLRVRAGHRRPGPARAAPDDRTLTHSARAAVRA